jgi:hypothetical protein
LLDNGAFNTRRQPSNLTGKANCMSATAHRITEENAHWNRLVELIEEDPDLAAKFAPLDGLSLGELFETTFGKVSAEYAIELLRRSLA